MVAVTSVPSLAIPSEPVAGRVRSLSLAVVGAGAAGLVAARELRREGHGVVVFECGSSVGGTWVYSPTTESDPLGIEPSRSTVHSSLYASLRTNLPRECMGFLDFPFVPLADGDGDDRRFPGHKEVLRYLVKFADKFDLFGLVRFRTEVVRVSRVDKGKWRLISRGIDGIEADELFDGVVVCNGHYSQPRIAKIPGVDSWPGEQLHSHNYRVPDPFLDKVVVIIGSSASAVDISRDIASFAKEVHIASRSDRVSAPVKYHVPTNNMWLHSNIDCAKEDGSVAFEDGSSVFADVIMHCTGYHYCFPFLEADIAVTVDDNRVDPLYKHIFPPKLGPELSFIGIPWKVAPFPLCELQSKWIAGVLSGSFDVPTVQEMEEDVRSFYARLEAKGWPRRYTHNFEDCQFEYTDWLAEQSGHRLVEEWRKQMYEATSKNRKARPESFRDEWDDDHLVEQAYKDFQMYL